ncbi:MAG: hypothetical protein ABIJ21_08735 [Nanoarchaeota archaeon]
MNRPAFKKSGMIVLVVSALLILACSLAISYKLLDLIWVFVPLLGMMCGGLLLALAREPKELPNDDERKLMSYVFLGLGVLSLISGGYHWRSEGVFYIGLIFVFIGLIYYPNKKK